MNYFLMKGKGEKMEALCGNDYVSHSICLVSMMSRPYCRGVKLIFTGGHISLTVAFKGPNVISTP